MLTPSTQIDSNMQVKVDNYAATSSKDDLPPDNTSTMGVTTGRDATGKQIVTPEAGVSLSETHQKDQRNNHPAPHLLNDSKEKMRIHVTYIVLGLFSFIVIYGLVMQNYWLVGGTCVPIVARGVYKIFERYL